MSRLLRDQRHCPPSILANPEDNNETRSFLAGDDQREQTGMKSECRGFTYHISVFCLLLAAVVFLAGCTNPEQAKAEHVARGEAYQKDQKFQEAAL